MTPDRLPLLVGILLMLHMMMLIFSWLDARLRPALLRIGLLDMEADHLHQIATMYHRMGLFVTPYLLAPPSSIPLAEARLLERRLILECIAISIGAMIPSGLFLAASNA